MSALHGLLFLATLVLVNVSFPLLAWPWYLALPLLNYTAIVLMVAPLRRSAPRLGVGRLGGMPLAYAVVIAVGAPVVLLAFHVLVCPDVTELAARLPIDSFGSLVMAGVVFSVINALLEELIFRGVLWEAVSAEWNSVVAPFVTAVLFAIGHYDGYPPGLLGSAMAGLYGFALGSLRWWSGGLGLATASHVCADATIYWILVE